ncbi:MAG: 2-hydroxychromene-2-carboxylate isomerase [Rhizobiaceae bacterium]|nr:MAG: 2-hydroxychromene-2-carboxylate isomerase [Rhizobiaceae bacterium]CAG1002130.1 2-hydroxychromene-2-carboxylate isomerase [Rhizobiaceae bacterium]
MEPIVFYFDFASPYAYFAADGIERIAAEHGRTVEWRAFLAWAAFKAHGISPPMDVPARHAYFITDMIRSAAFHGVPYRQPKLPVSTHRAARLFHVVAAEDPGTARAFARRALSVFFAEGEDIAAEAVVLRIAQECGIDAASAREAIESQSGRALLAAAVDRAVADGVCGSPFFLVDGEPFFGADRLPQIAWRLSQTRPTSVPGAAPPGTLSTGDSAGT